MIPQGDDYIYAETIASTSEKIFFRLLDYHVQNLPARSLATATAGIPVHRYGGLKDQDRIFTNVFRRIKGAKTRS